MSWDILPKANLRYFLQKIKAIIPTKTSDLANDSGYTDNIGTITGITMNGSSKGTSGVVDLGTVVTDVSGKADKSSTVSNVAYDTTNKKITKTINGTTSDVVAVSTLKSDMQLTKSDVGLSNVGNFKAVSTSANQGLTDTEKSNARANIGAGTSNFSGSYNALSDIPSSFPPSAHTHGNIQNGGTLQTNDVAIANGDKLVITDSSDSSKIARASIAFDGSTATKCLTQKGTWESFTNNAGTVTSVKVGSTSYSPSSGVVSLPAYPTVNNGTLTLKRNNTSLGTFTANQSGNSDINFNVAVNETLTNQNLNSVTTPGFYNAGGGNTCTNKPSGVDAFGLEVIHSASGNFYTQIIWSNTSAVPYRRNCNNGTWGSWTLDKLTDTTYTFTNKGATLAWSTTSTIATVGGVDIKVTMPANPNTDHYAWSDITGKPNTYTPSSHTHGNIQNGGTLQTNDITIASGDKLVVTDSSDSSKIARASISFDGSTATKCLTQKGTWESFTNNAGTVTLASVSASDHTTYKMYFGTTSGAGKYLPNLQYTPYYGKLVCYNDSSQHSWSLYDDQLQANYKTGSYLVLGNAVTSNTGGARIGVVRLYRNGYYTDIESSLLSANRSVEFPNMDGTLAISGGSVANNDSKAVSGGTVYSYLNSNYKKAVWTSSPTVGQLKTAFAGLFILNNGTSFQSSLFVKSGGSTQEVVDVNRTSHYVTIAWNATDGTLTYGGSYITPNLAICLLFF